MKNIIHGKCEYNGCKSRVYAQGLCYKHFTEQLNREMRENSEHEENRPSFFCTADTIVQIAPVIFVVILWLACSASAVMFGIYCYRCVHGGSLKIIIMAAALIAASYAVLRLLLLMFDKYSVSKYIFIALMLVFIYYAATNGEYLYFAYRDCLQNWAYAFAESMKGILF